MNVLYSNYDLLCLFFVYSFLGWLAETSLAAIKQKHWANRGLVNLPFCLLYGITGVFISIFCQELTGFWLFIAGMILATVSEWIAGHLIEQFYHEKWWDYSKIRWNLDGYVCLPTSLLWGVLSFIAMRFGNRFFLTLFHLIPYFPRILCIWILCIVLILDITATLSLTNDKAKHYLQWKELDTWFSKFTLRLGRKVYLAIHKRMQRAYPKAKTVETAHASQKQTAIFAYGCSFHKILWLFFIGAFLGDITETIFCRITAGVWMSRSSVVWGPFSIVWGLGIAAFTLLLYKYRNLSDRFLFIAGTFLGGAYEYICSVFTELVFGKVFWDYSAIPFNLGGRINLLYCFFWGIAAVIWMKHLYPKCSDLIEQVPLKIGKCLSYIMLLFMLCNVCVSCLALARSTERINGIAATSKWQQIMDERFDDARMQKIYPNALQTE